MAEAVDLCLQIHGLRFLPDCVTVTGICVNVLDARGLPVGDSVIEAQTLDSAVNNPLFEASVFLKASQYSMVEGIWLHVAVVSLEYIGEKGYRPVMIGFGVHPLINTVDSEARIVNHGYFELPLYSAKCITDESSFEDFLESER